MSEFNAVEVGLKEFTVYLQFLLDSGIEVTNELWTTCDPPTTIYKIGEQFIAKRLHPFMEDPDRYFINGGV